MKSSFLLKATVVSLLTAATTILPLSLSAHAQVTAPGVVSEDIYEDDDFDWGWLGLIGLFGLAGLAGKKRSEPTAYRDPEVRR
ncbi:WGxxGxxG family protein [Gloeocapsa sp. BRSZ]